MTASRHTARSLGVVAIAGALAAGLAAPASALVPSIISVTPGGNAGNQGSSTAVLSANGRWAVFSSAATNLVAGDTNGKRDVFVRDLVSGTTVLVSRRKGGPQANGDSDSSFQLRPYLGVSADGRYVVFDSSATNLVPGDTNGQDDVFRWDRTTGAIALVSNKAGLPGVPGNNFSRSPRISGDGRFVAYTSSATNLATTVPPGLTNANSLQVWVRDMAKGSSVLASARAVGGYPNDFSERADISVDGRYVVFENFATNTVPGDTNAARDVFRRDLLAGVTIRVSVKPNGSELGLDSYEGSISGNGRYVAFETQEDITVGDTNNQKDVYRRDVVGATTALVSKNNTDGKALGQAARPRIAANGVRVVFDNGAESFVRPMSLTKSTKLVDGVIPNISGNGKTIAFMSPAPLDAGHDLNGFDDAYRTLLSSTCDGAKPTITFSGAYAKVTDPSGIAIVKVNGAVKRLNAAGKVAVSSGQTIVAWDGAYNSLSKTRP